MNRLRSADSSLAVIALLLTFFTVGCTAGGNVSVRSTNAAATLAPKINLVASRPLGPGQVDLFMTDLTLDQVDLATPLEDLDGSIIHIQMFIRPKAGKTPIDSTATNATIRHVVFSSGAIGVYSGGGFLFPKSSKKADVFSAKVRQASLVLTSHTANFNDPLGPSTMTLNVRAPTNEALAALLSTRLNQTLDRLAP